jgi:hypothetical protein
MISIIKYLHSTKLAQTLKSSSIYAVKRFQISEITENG